jgi:dienelactone hydrolase
MFKYILSFVFTFSLLTGTTFADNDNPEPGKIGYTTIATDTGKTFRAYIAGSKEAKQGLLLLHGWRGLNHEMELWADRFAAHGYRVMAIDLYNNKTANHPGTARKIMNSINQEETNDKFKAAVKLLAQDDRKVAVLGRGFGANQAIHAASSNRLISAVVLFYPLGDASKLLTSFNIPILGNFASKNFFFDKELQKKFVSAANQKKIDLTIETYPARHGFSNILGENFDTNADSSSLKNTLAFLAKHLR